MAVRGDMPKVVREGPTLAEQTRASVLVAGFVLITLVSIPIQALALRLGGTAARHIPHVYHRTLCRMIGLRINQHGKPVTGSPVLMVSNHVSWLDIPILSTATPLSFIAKSEVKAWPFFGLLAELQRTVFVERQRRSQTDRQRDIIAARLGVGEALVLFPEGTSSDGNRVLPFNSALFSVAEPAEGVGTGDALLVQPVSLAYTGLHGLPMARRDRPLFAWYGDMDLIPHLWRAFGAGPVDVTLHFHAPVTVHALGSRKALAQYCQRQVAAGVAYALAGRAPEDLTSHAPEGRTSGVPAEAPAAAGEARAQG